MKILAPTIVALVALSASLSANRESSRPDSSPLTETSAPATPAPTPGLEGYCWPLSAARGETITFFISGSGSPTAEFFNLTASIPSSSSTPLRRISFVPLEQRTNPEPWRMELGGRRASRLRFLS